MLDFLRVRYSTSRNYICSLSFRAIYREKLVNVGRQESYSITSLESRLSSQHVLRRGLFSEEVEWLKRVLVYVLQQAFAHQPLRKGHSLQDLT